MDNELDSQTERTESEENPPLLTSKPRAGLCCNLGCFMFLFNYSNCVIGSGIISLPYSLSNSGLGLGLTLMTISAILTAYTAIILIKIANHLKVYNYMEIVRITLGRIPMHLLAICNALFPLFIAISYGIVIADNMEIFFGQVFPNVAILRNRQFILGIIYLVILLPLSLLNSVKLLEKTSALSIVCCLFYASVFFYKSFIITPKIVLTPDLFDFGRAGIAQTFSAYYFAMTIHHNVFQLYLSRNDDNPLSFSTATHITFSFSLIIYMIVGVSGYITFGGIIQGNLLNKYCNDDTLANVTRLIFAASIVLTYPLQIIASRQIIVNYFGKNVRGRCWIEKATSVVVLSVCILIAMVTNKFGPVVEIGGASTAAPLATLFPSFLYLKQKKMKKRRISIVIVSIILIVGLVAMVMGISMSIYSIVKPNKVSQNLKYWCDAEIS